MTRRGHLVTLGSARHRFGCHACQGREFLAREVKINTSGAELFGLGWASQSGRGLVCAGCGYLHTFVGATIELWAPENGYPDAS